MGQATNNDKRDPLFEKHIDTHMSIRAEGEQEFAELVKSLTTNTVRKRLAASAHDNSAPQIFKKEEKADPHH